jgi:uncharacterized protein YjcR
MLITLHKNATTTPAVRAAIQQSSASEYELACQYGVSRQTIGRWRKRDSVHDASHTPHRLRTKHLTPLQAMKRWRRSHPRLFSKQVRNHPGPDI